jgi:predicted pore-forming effector associated with SMODS systems
MHGYSTDSGERRIVPLLLASVAITLAWLSSKLLAVMHLSLPWWLDAPSTLGYYGALYALFDRNLWRNRFARKLGLVRVPNLTGRWRGYLLSSFDGHTKGHDLMINIFQSWTEIAVFLATETSISRSCAAVIQVDDPDGLALTYQYQSQPLANAMRTMHMHFGTATLRVSDDDTLTGDYYAGRDRCTFGRISCWREQSKAASPAELVLSVPTNSR